MLIEIVLFLLRSFYSFPFPFSFPFSLCLSFPYLKELENSNNLFPPPSPLERQIQTRYSAYKFLLARKVFPFPLFLLLC